MAVKKTQMYRKNLDTSETNLYPLTESQYVLMENGQTVQEVLSDRDSDKYTPVITDSSSTFKVGQGDNVDLSSSMKEGAYDSCVLKGKTMVNCIQEPSSKDVVLPYEFADGRYVTINDTKESGALGVELKGQTLVNLVPKKIIDYTASSDWDGYHQLVQNSKQSFDQWRALQDLKPNTKYFISCYVETFEVVNNEGYRLNNPSVESIFEDSMIVNGVGRYQWVSTTKSELTDEIFMALRCQNAFARGAIKIRDIMIIEYQQGMENWDIPYFEGMASCKMPILSTVGKNLFDGGIKNGSNLHINTGIEESGTRTIPLNFTRVKPNTTYTFSRPLALGAIGLRFYDKDKNYIKHGSTSATTSITFTTPNQCYYIKWVDEANKTTEGYQIEEGSTGTTYEPHKTSILSLPEEVVLRSLPNGVCDTFNTRTGVYTQRIGEVVLDGSHPTRTVTSVVNSELYQPYIISGLSNVKSIKETAITVNCDKLITRSARTTSYPAFTDNSIAQYVDSSAAFVGVLLKSTLGNLTPQQWFESNPVRVQYELETPVVTKINLSSTLKPWNTTTHIYSEIPENTLYPILSHSNPSYPVILKPNTKYSIVANSYSNSHTNSAINFNLGGATASTTVGNRVTTITTPSTLSNELLTMSGRGNKLNNVMVIEGDVAGDESYFEGICDCKSPILSNVGKNLFDVDGEFVKGAYSYGVPVLSSSNQVIEKIGENSLHITCGTNFYHSGWGQIIDVKNLDSVTISVMSTFSNSLTNPELKVLCLYESEEVPTIMDGQKKTDYDNRHLTQTLNDTNKTYTRTINTRGFAKVYVLFTGGYKAGGQGTFDFTLHNIYVGEESTYHGYESYKSNPTTFEQKDDKTIVLRSLPSGVCDTLNVETGEYVQNVVDVVLDGTENWTLNNWGTNDDFCSFEISSLNNAKIQNVYKQNSYIKFYCDTFRVLTNCAWNYMGEKHIRQWSDGNRTTISVIVPKSELKTYDVTGFIEYLTKNNIRINIRANNPIVSTVDIQGFPYAYTSGYVQLSSGHSGQSLTPKVEYSLSANKTGQINSNTKRVSAHQKQLDDFEAMMLTSMVQSAYDKAILQFDYEMQMMSLGGE